MIQYTLMVALIPVGDEYFQANIRDITFMNPDDVESVTQIDPNSTDPKSVQVELPKAVRSVVRIKDRIHGYRLHYVTETALEVANQWRAAKGLPVQKCEIMFGGENEG